MNTVSLYEIIGLIGVAGYVSAFAALQLGQIDGNSRWYSLINILNATLVLISLSEHFNLASALIQIFWILFGAVGIALKTWQNTRQPEQTNQFR